MAFQSAWRRLMEYCDGDDSVYAHAEPGEIREHVRTDILTLAEAFNEKMDPTPTDEKHSGTPASGEEG